MTAVVHRDAIAAETARFVAVIKDASLSTPVPSCPGWTLLDLVRHIGTLQRRFAALLRQRVQEPPASRDFAELHLPEHADGYGDWLAASAEEAASAFAVTDPDAAMWAWGADQHARFWIRRMLFETLVHRVDAERAIGLRPAIDRDLAVDGVDEFLVNLPFATPFAPKVANLRGDGETLRFQCTDADVDWLVWLRSDGFAVDRGDQGPELTEKVTVTPAVSADATVRGTAADLLLLLYGRLDRTSDAFTISGDEDLVAHWFANSEF